MTYKWDTENGDTELVVYDENGNEIGRTAKSNGVWSFAMSGSDNLPLSARRGTPSSKYSGRPPGMSMRQTDGATVCYSTLMQPSMKTSRSAKF